MKLNSYWWSSSAWRVRTVLAWKGIAYELVPIDLAPDVCAQHAAGFEQVNAPRQVPVLEWEEDGTTHRLTQSSAIAEWLEERRPFPSLLPDGALARARWLGRACARRCSWSPPAFSRCRTAVSCTT